MMKFKIPSIIIIGLLTAIIFLFEDYKTLGQFYFYILLIWGTTDLFIKKRIELIHVWNAGFGFIILSEVFSEFFIVTNNHLLALQFLITANNVILLGYISKSYNQTRILKPQSAFLKRKKRFFTALLLVLTLFFMYFKIDAVLSAVSGGRINETGEGNYILGSVINALGFILPAISAYYVMIIQKKTVLLAFLLSLPVFIPQFLIGTRFPLLFSVLGFFIVVFSSSSSQKLNFKQFIIGTLSALLLLVGSAAMKDFRAYGFSQSKIQLKESKPQKDFAETVLNFGSPEGVIDMTALMFDYFDSNEHLYGSSSSFLLYFWIPRSVWSDKPTMLGHWFIRAYRSGFSEGHSASFGFTGELYADFGLFSLIFIFFIGRLLKWAENFKNWVFYNKGYQVVLVAMIFPYVFFFVRSPITASMNFLGILFFYYLLKHFLYSKAQ